MQKVCIVCSGFLIYSKLSDIYLFYTKYDREGMLSMYLFN